MKYQWTDWIEHIPGQELVNGTYAIFEFQGAHRNGGLPYQKEGAVTPSMKGHGTWHATSPGANEYAMLLQYKLRSVSEEIDDTTEQNVDRTVAE